MRVRYAGEFAPKSIPLSPPQLQSGAGRAIKEFDLGELVLINKVCPGEVTVDTQTSAARSMPQIQHILCEPTRCTFVAGTQYCRGRRESYRVHTSSIEMMSGDTFALEEEEGLVLEPLEHLQDTSASNDNLNQNNQSQIESIWQLTIELVLLPSVRPPSSDTTNTTAGLTARVLANGRLELPRLHNTNFDISKFESFSDNRRLRLVGTPSQLQQVIQGLRVTAHDPAAQIR
jgi:hypothetical protein